jgi:hypothetical protein
LPYVLNVNSLLSLGYLRVDLDQLEASLPYHLEIMEYLAMSHPRI